MYIWVIVQLLLYKTVMFTCIYLVVFLAHVCLHPLGTLYIAKRPCPPRM